MAFASKEARDLERTHLGLVRARHHPAHGSAHSVRHLGLVLGQQMQLLGGEEAARQSEETI